MTETQDAVALDIRRAPGVCGGEACIGRTRIPVWLIVSFAKQGATTAEILRSYPSLTPEHIKLTREYYEAHQEEVDSGIRRQEDGPDPRNG